MAGIVKNMVRLGVIGTAVGAGAVVVAGPDRVMAVIHQAQAHVNNVIDENIDDPIALRNQLRTLEREYPQKISQVNSELNAVDHQIAQLEQEFDLARVKVELASNDLEDITSLIDKAEVARTSNTGEYSIIKISFDGSKYDLGGAYEKANRINQVRSAFSTHAAEIERDLGLFSQQRDRLANLLDQLQTERAEFQAQLWQIEQQIASIDRNDKLIDMLEERQRTLDRFESPYKVASLDGMKARLAEIRSEQELRMEALTKGSTRDDYDARARFLLEHQRGSESFETEPSGMIEFGPKVIEIESDDDGRVASRN